MLVGWDQKSSKEVWQRIERFGIYDMSLLYKRIKDWFDENNYIYMEKENTTNVKDKGVELKLAMIGDRKVTDYFKFVIDVRFLVVEMQKVKVKDKELDKGHLLMFLKAELYYDYRNTWSKNKFSKLLRFVYNNFIIRKKIVDVYAPALKYEADELFNDMKDVMDMYNP